jgi:hypothetical protein
MGNIFVGRLWRSLKYEGVYLNAYASMAEATRLRFPRLPNELGKRGNARLRPTHPQAPQRTMDLILMR